VCAEGLLFVNKKQPRNFVNFPSWALARLLPHRRDSGAEVFSAFF
jgi:hypothetical protein